MDKNTTKYIILFFFFKIKSSSDSTLWFKNWKISTSFILSVFFDDYVLRHWYKCNNNVHDCWRSSPLQSSRIFPETFGSRPELDVSRFTFSVELTSVASDRFETMFRATTTTTLSVIKLMETQPVLLCEFGGWRGGGCANRRERERANIGTRSIEIRGATRSFRESHEIPLEKSRNTLSTCSPSLLFEWQRSSYV